MDPPKDLSAAHVVARIIDGLGYRLYGALDGLTEADCTYRPSPDAQSIGQIIRHIWGLMNWMTQEIRGGNMTRPSGVLEQGRHVLDELEALRIKLARMTDDEFSKLTFNNEPFWHGLDRAICDMLHHTGQVSILRGQPGTPIHDPHNSPDESMRPPLLNARGVCRDHAVREPGVNPQRLPGGLPIE